MSKIIICCLILAAQPLALQAAAADRSKTMLMFVGEDLGVITIASRRAENAFSAPAVAEVMNHQESERRGVNTLAQALNKISGFYVMSGPGGSQPYLRGLKNSILFLYDGVPLNSTLSKNIHPLDGELSLDNVKKIEIIKGPGSVLWGPDAYAGIVNISPMTGSDINGLKSGISLSTPDHGKKVYILYGRDNGLWDMALSLEASKHRQETTSYSLSSFWHDGKTPTAPAQRFTKGELPADNAVEMNLNLSHDKWFSLSGRFSDYQRHVVGNTSPKAANNFSWQEEHSAPQYFVKLEAKKNLTTSTTLRGTIYYRNMDITYQYIDFNHPQREQNTYSELLFDHQMFSNTAVLTTGFSRRYTKINGALAWNSYPLGYVTPENTDFLPTYHSLDFSNRLNSAFFQYNQKLGDWSVMTGLRYDDHENYEDKISANLSLTWNFSHNWMSKFLYGKSYRTPFARQLADNQNLQLEEISTLQSQLIWRLTPGTSFKAAIFQESIRNHVVEDPYYGLSQPGSQRINGLELSGTMGLRSTIDLGADLTLLSNNGAENKFNFNDYTIITGDGREIKHYVTKHFPFDTGPKVLGGINLTWRPDIADTLVLDGRYNGENHSYIPGADIPLDFEPVYTLDVTFTRKFMQYRHDLELEVHAGNIFDRRYHIPGPYGKIAAPGFKLRTELRMAW